MIKKKIRNKIKELELLKDQSSDNVSLMGGMCGKALFYFYLSKYRQNQELYNHAYGLIEKAIDKINDGFTFPTFAGGLAGIGWTIEHLAQNDFLDVDANELFSDLEAYLFQSACKYIKKGEYDYLHGSLGIALYFLSCETLINKKQYIRQLLIELEKISIKEKNGKIKWLAYTDYKTKKKGYNISLSHGMSSIIVFLSKTYKAGINRALTKKMLEGSIRYLLAQKVKNGERKNLFPSFAIESSENYLGSRLAWCYGDLGIAIALWQASQALNNKKWEKEAIDILLHNTKRKDAKDTLLRDAGLCHGTAGIAHIYHRMYLNTKIEEFKETAAYWFAETLKMAKFEKGLAGYKSWRTEEYGGWQNDYGFLEGISGIGLTMISYVSDIKPAWDECLLLS